MDIEAELAGKNPKRVAGQVRNLVKARRTQFLVSLAINLIWLSIVCVDFYADFLPLFVQISLFIVVTFWAIGVFFEYCRYRSELTRLAAIEAYIKDSSQE